MGDSTTAQVDVLHPANERLNSASVWGCEHCLLQLEKAGKLQERLKIREGAADSEALTPAFTRVIDLYDNRLARAKIGAMSTLSAFQDAVEKFCSENNDTLSPGTNSKAIVRTVVKQQTDLGYFYEELTGVTHKVAKIAIVELLFKA